MKLLIVDDEELTRNGLLQSISWQELGITEVFLADDGIHGLDVALKERPEIILCDVRMPRMDGIQMAGQIQALSPDTAIIFMSGYSDKEYLKAAIKLRAINYVEKPLKLSEIQNTVLEAADHYRQKIKTHQNETLHQLESTSRLAMQLTFPYEKNREQITRLCELLSLTNLQHAVFTAFLVKFEEISQPEEEWYPVFAKELNAFLSPYHLSALMTERHQKYLVFHIFGRMAPRAKDKEEIISFFQTRLAAYKGHYLCCGTSISGIAGAYHSYETSVFLIQSSFFFDRNTFLTPDTSQSCQSTETFSTFLSHDYITGFTEGLDSGNEKACIDILAKLYAFFYQNTSVFSDQAREIYYKFFSTLQEAGKRAKIVHLQTEESKTLIRYIDQFYTFGDLHKDLEEKTRSFFRDRNHQTEENSIIFLIKDYIYENYKDYRLSVKDISEHVYLSVSYVCTIFKAETGKTLNQYITEYRMERAKKLLRDPRYKITDISAKVGYNDGNYFGKTFKKLVGLSPTEYREGVMK